MRGEAIERIQRVLVAFDLVAHFVGRRRLPSRYEMLAGVAERAEMCPSMILPFKSATFRLRTALMKLPKWPFSSSGSTGFFSEAGAGLDSTRPLAIGGFPNFPDQLSSLPNTAALA